MATQAQIEANRRNAQKSTGPVTAEGKAAVRNNAVRHGLRSRSLNLDPAQNESFTQLCAELEAAWHPVDQPEQIAVEAMALAYWKLARLERRATAYISALDPENPKVLTFERQIIQIQSALERSYARAQRELQNLQKTRASRQIQPQPEPGAHLNHQPPATSHQPPAGIQSPAPSNQHPPLSPQHLAPVAQLLNGEEKAKIAACPSPL